MLDEPFHLLVGRATASSVAHATNRTGAPSPPRYRICIGARLPNVRAIGTAPGSCPASRSAGAAPGCPVSERDDAVVVDEAQDFAESWWAPLLAALRDEESGGVFVFADEGQRVPARQGRPPVALVPILLEENLRNTVPIARTFGSLAPLQMRYRGGDRAPVRFVPCAAEDAVARADEEVERLIERED